MKAKLTKIFKFDAAHRLPYLHKAHKCRNLHGHSYKLEVTIKGFIDKKTGMVMDFADIDLIVSPVISLLDHNYLNQLSDLENPTCENIAAWIWARLIEKLPLLDEIKLYEGENNYCTYREDLNRDNFEAHPKRTRFPGNSDKSGWNKRS